MSNESSSITLSSNAVKRIQTLLPNQESNYFRVYVTGGGCSGFQYGFTFDENIEEGDSQIQNLGVTLLVDPMSIQYLMGAEIDYKEDLQGAQFVIRNPNAKTTCGCGSSFTA